MKNFDKFYNQVIQEQYTITAREVLYRRYGRENAENIINSIKSRGKDNYLDKKYVLPDYSDKTLDKIIPVVFKSFSEQDRNAAAYATPKQLGFPNQYIAVNNDFKQGREVVAKELQTGETPPQYDIPYDILGHERIHTQQKAHYGFDRLRTEIAPVLAELKFWYYKKTGIILDGNATDQDINEFINYCNKYNAFNTNAYGKKIDYEKLLKTSEGKEVFKRIVKQAPMKSDTMVA
jgi:hypothetical protein